MWPHNSHKDSGSLHVSFYISMVTYHTAGILRVFLAKNYCP